LEGVGTLRPGITRNFWTDRHVLVTGATGMIGSWLCHRLLEAGSRVVALVRDADPQSELLRSGTIDCLNVIQGRLEHYADVERAICEAEVDTVFHLGAQTIVGTGLRSPLATLATNVMGTAHVLEASRVHSGFVERVVVASSDKAYGSQETLPYTEETALNGQFPYEVSKSAADLVTQAYHQTYNLPVTIARCGNVYGGGDLNWSRVVPGAIRALWRDEPFVIRSDGLFLRDYIFVDDVVDAYLLLGESVTTGRAAGQAFNFSCGAPMTVIEMYEAVVKAMGAEYREPVILNQAAAEIRDQYLDSSKAQTELGWKPRHDVVAGLERTASWYTSLFSGEG
jgi:CDP-glucose 4,6-dehydratase